jgi:nucleotide-binding universal stress UspA family protein
VDPVIERVPCHVVILKNCSDQKFKRVLVPVAGGPNALLALEIGSTLAAAGEGEMVALHVRSDGSREERPFDVEAFVSEHSGRLALPLNRVHAKSIRGRHVARAILREASAETENYDLMVLGCTQDPKVYQFARDSVPERVARQYDKPLLMVKASGGIRSWINRWI